MAIPGATSTQVEVRGKVRVGKKTTTRSGKEMAASTDHFLSTDPEFAKLYPEGSKPTDLRVVFVHAEPEDVFRTGLEWWRGSVMACYTNEGGPNPTAFRVSDLVVREDGKEKKLSWLDPDDEIRGEPVGRGRTPIACRFRDCRHFGKNARNKECRVKGRLTFLLEGGRTDAALSFETKGWKTIEKIEATLASCRRSGPLNAPGRVFVLHVEIHVEGEKRHPVVTVREVSDTVQVNTMEDASLADALIQLRRIVDTEGATDAEIKLRIADVLDFTNAGWRERPEFVTQMQARVAEIGVVGAAKGLLSRYEVATAV